MLGGMDMYVEDFVKHWISVKEQEDEKESKKKKNTTILDHKKISKIKSNDGNDWVAIFIGILFVVGVAGVAVYQSFRFKEDELASQSSQKFQEFMQLTKDAPPESTGQTLTHPGNVVPMWYTLYLDSYISTMNYTGLVKIRVKCASTTKKIILNSKQHMLHKIAVKTVNVTDIEDILVLKYSHNNKTGTLELSLNQVLVQNYEYDIYVGFMGNLSYHAQDGMYVSTYKEKDGKTRKMINANFKQSLARKVFPCFDEPMYKAKFKLILPHDKEDSAQSNTAVEQLVQMGKTRDYETHFQFSKPISCHQVAFEISKYVARKVNSPKNKVGLTCPKGRENEIKYAAKITPSYMSFFQKQFGVNFGFDKLDLSPSTKVIDGVSETVGLVQIFEPNLLLDQSRASSADTENTARSIAEAVVTQWIGGLVTTKSWHDEWVIASLIRYLRNTPLEDLYPTWQQKSVMYMEMNEQLLADSLSQSLPVTFKKDREVPRASFGNFNQNAKGAAIMEMLVDYLGNETFYKSIKPTTKSNVDPMLYNVITAMVEYLEKYQFKDVVYDDFLSTVVQIAPSIDIIDYMNSWVYQPGYPLITMQPSQDGLQIMASQAPFKYNNITDPSSSGESLLWRVSLDMHNSCAENNTRREFMDEQTERFVHSCQDANSWYKAKATGYFRVNYNSENWDRIILQLAENHLVFSVSERASLIADTFELAYFNHMTITRALRFISYLEKESYFVPWNLALKNMKFLIHAFKGTKVETCMKKQQEQLVLPMLKQLNKKKSLNHDEKRLHAILTEVQLTFNKNLVIEQDNIFLKWIISGERDNITPHMREVILKTGIIRGSHFEFDALMEYYTRTNAVSERLLVLKTLALSTNQQLLARLVKSVDDAEVIFPDDKLTVLSSVCQNYIGQPFAWTYIKTYWKDLYNMALNESLAQLGTVITSCLSNSNVQSDLEVRGLVGTNNVGPFDNLFKQMEEKINLNIAFGQRLNEVLDWLEDVDPLCME